MLRYIFDNSIDKLAIFFGASLIARSQRDLKEEAMGL